MASSPQQLLTPVEIISVDSRDGFKVKLLILNLKNLFIYNYINNNNDNNNNDINNINYIRKV